MDKKEPKYLSNLSAVLFEVGKYEDAIHSVVGAWSCLKLRDSTESSILSNSLTIKLITRFAKAKMYETRSKSSTRRKSIQAEDNTKQGQLECKVEREMEDFVTSLGSSITDDLKVVEMKKAWTCWRAMRSDLNFDSPCLDGGYESRVSTSAERFRALSIFKSAPYVHFYYNLSFGLT